MAGPEPAAVRNAIAETLQAALDPNPGVNVNAYATSQPTPPGLQILPPAITYDFAVSLDQWEIIVQGFVAFNTDVGAQVLLDELIAPSGVKAALEADDTLGGLVDDLHVVSSSQPRQVMQDGLSPMLLVEWRLSMLVRGA